VPSRSTLPIPANLASAADDRRRDWLARLPATVADLARTWSLEVGPPYEPGGSTAWVAPATGEDHVPLVLKVGWRHLEAEHEAAALRVWNGHGAVRLVDVRAFKDTVALLLERCIPGTTLKQLPELQQDTVVAPLLKALWIRPPPGHPFRSLTEMCNGWANEFEAKLGRRGDRLDDGLIQEGMGLFRSLPTTAEREVLLATDLHADNVLAAQREPWLVVDPKPYVGDPTYDALQHMLNCEERLHTDPRALSARVAALLDLDPVRLELWLFARCVQESLDWPGLASVAHRLAPR
jgi:streptomycin 6-kinase